MPTYKIPNEQAKIFLLDKFKDINKTDADSIAADIIRYFPENGFEYSLNVKLDRKEDPLYDFMKKKKGHCELYAQRFCPRAKKLWYSGSLCYRVLL